MPHDAQVRRISWVVGSVGWYASDKRFLVPYLCTDRPPFT